jgi:glycosyltransferase involved in cell wall biosynthesis
MRSSTPAITVAISTYNWSSALRCAIRSVLLQTVQDFEVLVVGDGCTDDSAAVVAAFGDKRLRWHNLDRNHGTQSAPNNFANENATSEWLAYLGHDDIWYPTHLEAVLRTARGGSADMIASVMVLYGPPGSGVRGLAGVFPSGSIGPTDFVPPSALAHSRAISSAGVRWRSPDGIAKPVDVTFFAEAAAVSRPKTTNELTCFKFNAAWRRDSYHVRSVTEQERMLQRIESGADFRQREYLDVLQAVTAGKFIHIRGVVPANSPPGRITRNFRKWRGLESRHDRAKLRPVERPMRFRLAGQDMPFEWHPLQFHLRHGSYRWTGPNPRATIDLPIVFDRDLAVAIHIVHAISADAIESLTLSVHGQPIPYRVERLANGCILLRAQLRRAAVVPSDRDFGVTMEFPATARPCDFGPSKDDRWLGVAVNWIEVAPLDGGEAPGLWRRWARWHSKTMG